MANRPTLIVHHPDCEKHHTGPGHPENAERLRAFGGGRHADHGRRCRGGRQSRQRLLPEPATGDPLAGLTLEPADYHDLTRKVAEVADSHCEGRVVSALEGGYDLRLLAECGLAHVTALAGLDLG